MLRPFRAFERRLTPVKHHLVSCRVGDTCVVHDFGIRVNSGFYAVVSFRRRDACAPRSRTSTDKENAGQKLFPSRVVIVAISEALFCFSASLVDIFNCRSYRGATSISTRRFRVRPAAVPLSPKLPTPPSLSCIREESMPRSCK